MADKLPRSQLAQRYLVYAARDSWPRIDRLAFSPQFSKIVVFERELKDGLEVFNRSNLEILKRRIVLTRLLSQRTFAGFLGWFGARQSGRP